MNKLTGPIIQAPWLLDETLTLNLRFPGPHGEVHAFIDRRPAYCDRGHWRFGIMHGVPSLDGADSFPRYFMSLQAALEEAERWLLWRLYKIDLDDDGRPWNHQFLLSSGRIAEFPAHEN